MSDTIHDKSQEQLSEEWSNKQRKSLAVCLQSPAAQNIAFIFCQSFYSQAFYSTYIFNEYIPNMDLNVLGQLLNLRP